MLHYIHHLMLLQILAIVVAIVKNFWIQAYFFQVSCITVYLVMCRFYRDTISSYGLGGVFYGLVLVAMYGFFISSVFAHVLTTFKERTEDSNEKSWVNFLTVVYYVVLFSVWIALSSLI